VPRRHELPAQRHVGAGGPPAAVRPGGPAGGPAQKSGGRGAPPAGGHVILPCRAGAPPCARPPPPLIRPPLRPPPPASPPLPVNRCRLPELPRRPPRLAGGSCSGPATPPPAGGGVSAAGFHRLHRLSSRRPLPTAARHPRLDGAPAELVPRWPAHGACGGPPQVARAARACGHGRAFRAAGGPSFRAVSRLAHDPGPPSRNRVACAMGRSRRVAANLAGPQNRRTGRTTEVHRKRDPRFRRRSSSARVPSSSTVT